MLCVRMNVGFISMEKQWKNKMFQYTVGDYMMKDEILIRRFQLSDFDDLNKLLSDPEVMRFIEPPYSPEQTKDFLFNAGLCDTPLVYAVENEKHFLGYVIFHEYDADSFELGWVLGKKYWGMGYASVITEILVSKAAEMKKDLVIECVPGQEATNHIALANGFTYIGNIDGLDVFRLKIR